ncbi:diheme cytochrome c [Roseateles sp. BYS180W]|uniref:Diheme cytochrome c n=1 Tax=Roseateles rivi TaxID=3299028 RepID=A0ABW7FTP6_9BURK
MSARRISLALGLALAGSAALADGPRVALTPTYRSECASCHVPYAPGHLGADSWRRLMGRLDQHFGSNAQLDPATLSELSSWLQSHAATGRRAQAQPPEDRITTSAWFQREHHEIDSAVWRHAAVKSAANCAACHTQADQGSYRERELRIPSGLPAALRRGFDAP